MTVEEEQAMKEIFEEQDRYTINLFGLPKDDREKALEEWHRIEVSIIKAKEQEARELSKGITK